MNNDTGQRLGDSLFAATSAFVQPLDTPYPVDIAAPVQITSRQEPDYKAVLNQIADLLDLALETPEEIPTHLLEQALDLAREHA